MNDGQTARAVEAAQRRVCLEASPQGYGILAQCLMSDDRTAKAVEAAQKAVGLQPNAQQYGILAQCLMSDGQTAKAVEAAQKAVGLQPNAQQYGILARCLMSDGQTAKAVEAAQKAVGLQPNAQQYGILAEMYRKDKKYHESLRVIEQAEAQFKSCANLELTRAYCLMGLGEIGAAFASLSKAEGYFVSGQFGKGPFDSRVKLYSGFLFLLESASRREDPGEEIRERAKKSANLLRQIDPQKLGVFQLSDCQHAMRIAKESSLL
jgi:tetratricopeptide (TPR) repeat protein